MDEEDVLQNNNLAIKSNYSSGLEDLKLEQREVSTTAHIFHWISL